MKFCIHCGNELANEATVCNGCGCEVKNEKAPVPPQVSKKQTKVKKLWIILSAVVLALAIIAAVLFVPRDLKMDDFAQVNVVSAIVKYGWPEDIIRTDEDGNVSLIYGKKVNFYGITPGRFAVAPESNSVVFLFNEEDGYKVYEKISRYCELYNKQSTFHWFKYKNLTITTMDYDGGYVYIEID